MTRIDRLRSSLRCGIAALLAFAFAGPAAAQVIAGRVIDAESGAGVQEARISVVTGRREVRQALTSADGRFSIAVPGGGSYRVQALRTGYEPGRSRAITVAPPDTARVDVRLRPAAVELRKITATARRRRLGTRGVFRLTSDGDPAAALPVSATPLQRSIQARGIFIAPNSCYQLSGVADRLNSVVTLYVQARPNGNACVGTPVPFKYSVTVRGISSGSYTFRILHLFRNAEVPPMMALDTAITVP